MKEKYEKPEMYTDDVSIAFSGACCTTQSPVDSIPGDVGPLFGCLPGCHYDTLSYSA